MLSWCIRIGSSPTPPSKACLSSPSVNSYRMECLMTLKINNNYNNNSLLRYSFHFFQLSYKALEDRFVPSIKFIALLI